MDPELDLSVAAGYSSDTQRARVISEDWVGRNFYCPSCGAEKLLAFPNNNAAADFYCADCRDEYELKSARKFESKVVNGAFNSLNQRVIEGNNPNLVLLRMCPRTMSVADLELIPR